MVLVQGQLLLATILSATIVTIECDSFLLSLGSVDVEDFQLSKCDPDRDDPVSVENVSVRAGNDGRIVASGTLVTSDELATPLKASVTLKKKTWLGWIYIPCERKLGSCDYDDLCAYGYPAGKECPPDFVRHNVPCRCPIRPGTYTLPPSTFRGAADDRSVFSGKYKGNVFVSHRGERLACYNMNFVLVEKET